MEHEINQNHIIQNCMAKWVMLLNWAISARPYCWLKQDYYLFKSWLQEISFGKFMTILDLWYFIAKSSKKFTGGKEDVSVIAVEIIKVTKTLIVQAMTSPLSWIWAIDNISSFLLHLKKFYWLSTWQHLLTFIHLRGRS